MDKMNLGYVLGDSFSGSTLFALLMGAHPRIVNLAEVVGIEYDYHPNRQCTCGLKLRECQFWNSLLETYNDTESLPRQEWYFDFGENGRDPFWRQQWPLKKVAATVVGNPGNHYDESFREQYIKKNLHFLKALYSAFPKTKWAIDASKDPTRLDILRRSNELRLFTIYLKRRMRDHFASRMKRCRSEVHARSLSYAMKTALRVRLKRAQCERVFQNLNSQRAVKVHWDDFVASPRQHLSELYAGMGTAVPGEKIQTCPATVVETQHVYTGNQLRKRLSNIKELRARSDSGSLRPQARLAMKIILPKNA